MENTVHKIAWYSLLTLIMVVLIGVVVLFKGDNPVVKIGSVATGESYEATTTSAASDNVTKIIKVGQGALGSVIVTVAGNKHYTLYNATTTDVSKRTGNKATSTIIIADFPPSLAVGTYTFDITFTDGLLFNINAGTLGTTTITYR